MAERKKPPIDWHMTDGEYTYKWIAAWGTFLLLMGLFNRTRTGHRLIYNVLVIIIFTLVLTQYKTFETIEEPISGLKLNPTGGS